MVDSGLLECWPTEPFDAVVFVASLHHVGLNAGITRALDLLAPAARWSWPGWPATAASATACDQR